MRKHTPLILLMLSIAALSCNSGKEQADTREEWIQLFNKKDLSGWDVKLAKHALNENFNNTFIVEDSLLKIDYSGYSKFDGEFGHLYYKEPFSYYRIRTEYRITGTQKEGGPVWAGFNSGIMLHSQSAASMGKDQAFPVSLEMQFLASDSTERTTGNLCTPGTYVHMNNQPALAHCINSSSAKYKVGEWVTAEAVVLGDSIIHHIINGDTILSYTGPMIGDGFISKNQSWINFGFGADSAVWTKLENTPLTSGYIALQAESHPLEFRKMELLNLQGCTDKNARNYKPYYIRADNSKCQY